MLKQKESAKAIQQSFGKIFARLPLSPNHWTVLSLLSAAGASIAIGYFHELGAGILLFAVAGFLDMLDGAVAREKGEATAWGGFLDGVTDRLVEALFLFSLMFYPLPTVIIMPQIWLALLLFLGTLMPSFVRAYADHKGVISRESALAIGGIFERGERVGLLALGLAAGILLSMEYFIYAVILAALLSAITVIQRTLKIRESS